MPKIKYGSHKSHPLFYTFHKMLARCYKPYASNYSRYGGRGITVCDRWSGPNGFIYFCQDMGPKPTPGHSIDRIDVNGNYEPSNCRWATRYEQGANKQQSSGHSGVTLIKKTNRWRVRIKVRGREVALGYYADFRQALEARSRYMQENALY